MHRLFRCLIAGPLLCAAAVLTAQNTAPSAPLDAYAAVGSSMVQDNRLGQLGWTEAQVEAFLSGVRAAFRGEGRPVDAVAQGLLNDIGRRMQEMEQAERRRQFGTEAFAQPGHLQTYLKDISKQFQLERSDSGLCYGIKAGYGARPGPEDTVIMSYKVNLADTTTEVPALAVNRQKVRVGDLLPGLAEALQMMTVDSAAMLVLPPDLSFGAGEWPAGTERGTPLLFTVKLHEVIAAP
jgi:FKBP-type peptidyl-prolyl cis-trans isomerase FkpA